MRARSGTSTFKRAAAVGATALVLLAGACSSGDSTSSSPDGTSGSSSSGEFDPNATLRIAYAAPSDTLDPHKPTIAVAPVYDFPIYDRLFDVDGEDNIVPMVAESSSFAPDGTYFEVKMREDVTFHDGTPVDAAAVKASIERGKTVTGSTVSNLLKGITAVEVVEPYTVRFLLDGAGPEVPSILATHAGAIMNPTVIADPSADLARKPPAAAGSGPYIVEDSQQNASVTYKSAPTYWEETPRVATLSITFVPQSATRVAGLEAGDFDLVQVSADAYQNASAAAESGSFEMLSTPAASRDLVINIEKGKLSDPDVRRAISLAVDRDAVATVQPCTPNSQPYMDNHWAYNPEITIETDTDTARSLVEEAGPVAFEVAYGAGSSYEQVATVLQSQLGEVGIDLALRPVEQAQVNQLFSEGSVDAIMQSIIPTADPILMLNQNFFGGQNIARGPIGDEVKALAATATEPGMTQEERAPIYQEMFATIMDNYLYIPVCQSTQGWAHKKDIVGLDTMPGLRTGTVVVTRLGVAQD
jgi:peptide/nickel transport system substrate-binding protein